jgi:hypothetical protein
MYDRLLSYLRQHFQHDELPYNDPWGCMESFGNEPNALLYAQLFCPKFVEIDGSVLLDDSCGRADSLRAAKATARDFEQALNSFNWLEVPYLFGDRTGSDEGQLLLAEFVAELWRARLHYLYQPRKFEVVVETAEQTDDVVHVSFREIR